jgi:hypothetical protein
MANEREVGKYYALMGAGEQLERMVARSMLKELWRVPFDMFVI